jgi:predicted O-methyltransferase YrrM
VAILPQSLRSLTPTPLRDDVRLRALAVGLGLIPPRTMHSEEDARVLLEAARGARRVVEIGVYEGASALALQRALGGEAELHLIDPFGSHPDALPGGWGASERATKRLLARAGRRLG